MIADGIVRLDATPDTLVIPGSSIATSRLLSALDGAGRLAKDLDGYLYVDGRPLAMSAGSKAAIDAARARRARRAGRR